MGNYLFSMVAGNVASGDNTDITKYVVVAVVMFIFIIALIITEILRRKKK